MEDWIYTNKFKFLFIGAALLVVGIAFIILYLAKPKIASEKDLYFFTGKITDRQSYNGGRRAKNSCWFMLEGYSNIFDIDRANLHRFDKQGFTELKIGDSATVGVSLIDSKRLNADQSSIFIFYFKSGQVELSYSTSIENYNRKTMFYIGIGLIALSLLLFYNRHNSSSK